MGQGTTETLKEIEQTRDRLEHDIRDLEQRLPEPAVWTKRLAGVAAGGGVGGTVFWITVRRIRKRSRARSSEAAQASEVRPHRHRFRTLVGLASLGLHIVEFRELKRLASARRPT